MYYTIYKCSFATIILSGDENGLTNLTFDVNDAKRKMEIPFGWQENSKHFEGVIKQLDEYFAGTRKEFDVKLNPKGTEFQMKVWKELQRIPYGETRTYKDIALAIGEGNASRAVGAANGRNPIALIVPCHRVVGADGSLTGYAYGVDLKKKLLDFEKNNM